MYICIDVRLDYGDEERLKFAPNANPVGDTTGLPAGGVAPGNAGLRVAPGAMAIGWLRLAVAATIGAKMVCGP